MRDVFFNNFYASDSEEFGIRVQIVFGKNHNWWRHTPESKRDELKCENQRFEMPRFNAFAKKCFVVLQ
jgi:hypothetical protein